MSNSAVIKYQPLSQSAPSDDEDEGFHDNVLYDSRLVVRPAMDHRNVFELEKLGQPRIRSPGGVQSLRRGRQICILAVVLIVIVLSVLVAVLFPILNHKYNHGIVTDVHTGKTSPDWLRVFNNTLTHGAISLLDVDGDGLDDLLVGVAPQTGTSPVLNTFDTLNACCSSSQDSTYRYGGHVVALRGYDGAEIWRAPTCSAPNFISCMDVDANGDGRMDCIVAGSNSNCQAIDILTGTTLWAVDPASPRWSSHFIPGWDVSSVLTVSDVDSDGVLDLVVSLSVHEKKPVQDQAEKSGRLMMLSGQTGQIIGSTFMVCAQQGDGTVPLVKIVTPEGGIYIVYGTGGGASGAARLMVISLPDLYSIVTGHSLPRLDLSVYGWLQGKQMDDDSGLTVLFRGQSADDILIPVLVETDKQIHSDILVSSSSGFLVLLNGQTLEERWRRDFPDLGIYRAPTLGYFDADLVPDLMVQLRSGLCDLHGSQMLVLSGTSGETLWAFTSENDTLSSYLSLESGRSKSSVFVVAVKSANTSLAAHLQSGASVQAASDAYEELSDLGLPEICEKMKHKFTDTHVTCDQELGLFTERVFLFDRIISDLPLRLLDRPAYRYTYSLPHIPGEHSCHSLSRERKDRTDMCTVLFPAISSGAVGDVDADGSLDYIHVTQMIGLNTSSTFHVTGSVGSVVVSKHSIRSAVTRGDFQHICSGSDPAAHQRGASSYRQHVQSWQLSQAGVKTAKQHLVSTHGCVLVPS